jgi:hypothetical protein
MTPQFYVWVGGKVLELNEWQQVRRFKRAFIYKPQAWDKKWRVVRNRQWSAVPKDKVPREFLLALLLLEVRI